jgi:alpha-beta hydrolase superfamily lysophospholipase
MKLLLGLLATLSITSALASDCPPPWVCETLSLRVPYTVVKKSVGTVLTKKVAYTEVNIRAGYIPETGTLKGNIIYYQGLGDSMVNHEELFTKLSRAGYRVLSFDYMGQGKSSGTMNKTRIEYIPWIGEKVWNRYADTSIGHDRIIMGWSTGGLAAYMQATKVKSYVKKVILIGPGNTANYIVGEGLNSWPPNLITLRTLTTDNYDNGNYNPHIDEIRPISPVVVPAFSVSLLTTAAVARKTQMPAHVQGLVLLGGSDTYVDSKEALKVFAKTAPHFRIRTYPGALHEIHNERRPVRESAHSEILKFLERDQ